MHECVAGVGERSTCAIAARTSAAAGGTRPDVRLPCASRTGVSEPGAFVHVPFGPQQRLGIVWDKPIGPEKPLADEKLKAIIQELDVPHLPQTSLRFAEWIARYTLAPLGMVARMMMSAKAAFEPEKPRFGVAIVPDAQLPPRMTPAREKVLKIAQDGQIRAKAALARMANCTSGVVDGLVTSGNLVECAIPEKRYPAPDPKHVTNEFSDDQTVAVHALRAAAGSRHFSVTLLDGVTGSGKTEVYYEAVAAALEGGQSSPHHVTGNRVDESVHGPFRRTVRLCAGRVALRAQSTRARTGLEGGGQRPGTVRCWCPFGVVFTV